MLLGLSRLAEIFEDSQGSEGGVEEGEEISEEDVVKEELTIAVGIGLSETGDQVAEDMEMLSADDLLGPDGEIVAG
jgi:hypothetical protein